MTQRVNKGTIIPSKVWKMVLFLLSATAWPVASSPEYQVKAALIYKLTKFISWPEDSLNNGSHFGICILGDNRFGAAIKELENQTTKGKPITIKHFQYSDGINSQCQVVFIEQSKERFLVPIFNSLAPHSVLTIGDFTGFAETGGVLELRNNNGKTEFVINLASLKKANLLASAPLLELATTIAQNGEK